MRIDSHNPKFLVDLNKYTYNDPLNPGKTVTFFDLKFTNMVPGTSETLNFTFDDFNDIEELLDKFSIAVQSMRDILNESTETKTTGPDDISGNLSEVQPQVET